MNSEEMANLRKAAEEILDYVYYFSPPEVISGQPWDDVEDFLELATPKAILFLLDELERLKRNQVSKPPACKYPIEKDLKASGWKWHGWGRTTWSGITTNIKAGSFWYHPEVRNGILMTPEDAARAEETRRKAKQ